MSELRQQLNRLRERAATCDNYNLFALFCNFLRSYDRLFIYQHYRYSYLLLERIFKVIFLSIRCLIIKHVYYFIIIGETKLNIRILTPFQRVSLPRQNNGVLVKLFLLKTQQRHDGVVVNTFWCKCSPRYFYLVKIALFIESASYSIGSIFWVHLS